MSADQTIVFDGASEASDGTVRTSYQIPRPPCQTGDLLLCQIGAQERVTGWGAYLKDTADAAAFTDLLTDGYYQAGCKGMYVIPAPAAQPLLWWAGWKIATAADATEGAWTFDIDSPNAPPGYEGSQAFKADVVAYRGATGVGTHAARWQGINNLLATIDCPDVGYGPRQFHAGHGTTDYHTAISLLLTAAGSDPLLVCGAMVFYASVQDILATPPLLLRESSLGPDKSGAWAENAPLNVNLHHPEYVGHDK